MGSGRSLARDGGPVKGGAAEGRPELAPRWACPHTGDVEPHPRGLYITCPRCGRLEVSLPWDLARVRQRRRLGAAALALALTYPAWLAAGLALRAPLLWLLPLAAYAVAGALLAGAAYRSARVGRCLACGHTWRPGASPPTG